MNDHLAIIRELDYLAVRAMHSSIFNQPVNDANTEIDQRQWNHLTFKHVRVTEISISYLNVI